jgi:CubicO group peptidase (beta-lactamase class C family)
MQHAITSGDYPGMQLSVIHRNKLIIQIALGEARPSQPMTTDTILLLLSSGKPFLSVLVAQLIEQNRMGLDDLVSRYIPEFAVHGKEAITVRHILMHTGGFRTADRISDELPWEDHVQQICEARCEPNWQAGFKAGYHLIGSWNILAECVQRITKKPIAEWMKQKLFDPLGMSHTSLGIQDRLRFQKMGWIFQTDQQTTPHPKWNTPEHASRPLPASNARGTATDLARFYQMLMQGGVWQGQTILKEETTRTWTSAQRVGMLDLTFQHVIDWGLGFMINSNRYGKETVPYGFGRYASDDTFGHSGSQSSCGFLDRQNRLAVGWVANGRPGDAKHQTNVRNILSALYEDLELTDPL